MDRLSPTQLVGIGLVGVAALTLLGVPCEVFALLGGGAGVVLIAQGTERRGRRR